MNLTTQDIPKIEPYSDKWEEHAGRLARSYAPEIYPCAKCNWPVVSGYCCHYCGTNNPRSKKD